MDSYSDFSPRSARITLCTEELDTGKAKTQVSVAALHYGLPWMGTRLSAEYRAGIRSHLCWTGIQA